MSVHDGAVRLLRHRHKRLLRLVQEEEFSLDHVWVESLPHQLTFDLFEGPRHVQLVLRRNKPQSDGLQITLRSRHTNTEAEWTSAIIAVCVCVCVCVCERVCV